MLNETIAMYAIIDDLLKPIGHRDDCRRKMSDTEIITTAMVAALFFNGNQVLARAYLKDHGLIPKMLEKSRFCRRWNQLFLLLDDLFHQLGLVLKQLNGSTEYLLDSFPVPLCDNIRIFGARLVKSEEYRGYIASKKRYFYGVRVQLLSTDAKTTQTGDYRNRSLLREEPEASQKRYPKGAVTNAVVPQNRTSESASGIKSASGARSFNAHPMVTQLPHRGTVPVIRSENSTWS